MRTENAVFKKMDEIMKELEYVEKCVLSGNADKVEGVSGLGDSPRDYSLYLEGLLSALNWVMGKRMTHKIKLEFLYKEDPEIMEWTDPFSKI